MSEKKCTKCGKIFNDDASFCDECGGKVEFVAVNTQPNAEYICSKCGKMFEEKASFCDECGGKVNYNGVNISSSKDEYTKAYIILTLFPYTGWFGIHRFYKKDYLWGIIYIFTLGLFLGGWIYDVVKVVKHLQHKKNSK